MPNPKFFQNFPTTEVSIDRVQRTITDITPSIGISSYFLLKTFPFYDYIIQDGERPDHVSFKHYGDTKHYWIILITNNISDVWKEWPLDSQSFKTFMINKYGSVTESKSKIVKYFNVEDNIEIDYETYIDSSSSTVRRQSAYEYEIELNEQKRRIRLIQPKYISQIQSELKQLFSQ